MYRRLPLLFRAIAYGLRGGFLIRPFVIALALGIAGGWTRWRLSGCDNVLPRSSIDWAAELLPRNLPYRRH
jgi:hypothetical protein